MEDVRPPPKQGSIQQLQMEAAYAFGSLDSLVIAVTREPPTEESISELIRVVEELRRTDAKSITVVIAPRARRPKLSPEARQAILQHWERLETSLACCVVLFRPSGFVSAIQRSLVTAIMNMRRSPVPVKVSADPLEAAEFIVSHDPRFGAARALGNELRTFIEQCEP
jgi:phosphoribosylpyrophosphate synthetase